MANGFSVSCISGRRELMEQGSIEKVGQERVFLLSTTHGAEMSGLGAFIKTVEVMQKENVIEHLWDYGYQLKSMMNQLANKHGVGQYFEVSGPSCSPVYNTLDTNGKVSLELRTLFSQEMLRNGVMMPWIALCLQHSETEFRKTEEAVDRALTVYKKALAEGVEHYLQGSAIKPVFRKHN